MRPGRPPLAVASLQHHSVDREASIAATAPDTSLSATEIQELRRLMAAGQLPGRRIDSLAITPAGVFVAGFLAFIGWIAFETQANGKSIVALQTDIAILKTDVGELKTDLVEIKARQAEMDRKIDRLLELQRR